MTYKLIEILTALQDAGLPEPDVDYCPHDTFGSKHDTFGSEFFWCDDLDNEYILCLYMDRTWSIREPLGDDFEFKTLDEAIAKLKELLK
jgi:hypothetical protein